MSDDLVIFPDLGDQLVTDTIDYRDRKVTFKLKRVAEKPELMLWFVEATISDFLKPLNSKLMVSVFARDTYEKASQLSDPQEYLDALFVGVKGMESTKCELLTATLDSISIMWYCDGQVQIEVDEAFVGYVKNLIDLTFTEKGQGLLHGTGYVK